MRNILRISTKKLIGEKELLYFLLAGADTIIKDKRKDILSQDLDGFFSKVHYVLLEESPFKPYIETLNKPVYKVVFLSNKRFKLLHYGILRHINTLISYFLNIFYLIGYIKKNNITIIFAQEPFIRGTISYMLSKLTNTPYIIEVCSNFNARYWREGKRVIPMFHSIRIEKAILNFILTHADAVIADRDNYWDNNVIPHTIKDKYYRYHFSMEEAHYTTPEQRTNLKPFYGAKDKKVVLYIGRLHPDKRSEDLVPFARHLFNEHSIKDVEMWIVSGDSPLKTEVMRKVTEIGLSDMVKFIDNQPTAKVADFLYTADVVIAPHAGWVIPECQLAETPIVVYNYEWHREAVMNGKYGIIVPYRDTKAMANAVIDILSHREKYEDMTKQARQYVLKNNTLEREIEDKLRIFKTVLGKQ